MMLSPENVYQERIKALDLQLARLKRTELVLSYLKLALVSGIIFYLFKAALHYTDFSLAALLFFLTAFIIATIVHERFISKRNFQRTLREINAEERETLQGAFLDYGDGREYADTEHEYASDLDIFGSRSIFHFINRTTTSLGDKALSSWLRAFPGRGGIEGLEEKQKAVRELSAKIGFRQSLQAHGKGRMDSLDKLKSIEDFFAEPDVVFGRKFLIGFIHLFPLLTVALFASIFFGLSWLVPVGFVLIQGTTNRIYRQRVSRLYVLTAKNYKNLSLYSKIVKEIEEERFRSPSLDRWRRHFFLKNKPASFYIKKLATRFQYFEARSSAMIHFFMNNVFFWDLHCIYRIEKWKKDIKPEIDRWFEAIGCLDALCSLGNLQFNHPDWCMPEVRDGAFELFAASIGHPLIPSDERVVNSIKMGGDVSVSIVTGPNMAGKTTFLKTIGVNAVLALAGAPVCAQKLTLNPLHIYTSMKASDSLDKRLSFFYAELRRLKMVLDAIIRKEPVFFLVDEMLKGTNELDRRKGAFALIRQLIGERAKGMMATHDLELTGLEREYPGCVHNYHFDGTVEKDRLLFDYRLKKGVCQSSNALELMKRMGIKVP